MLNGKYILVVDDVNSDIETLTKVLLELGARKIDVAHDGKEGLKMLINRLSVIGEEYDLIFSDINMPSMNGIEFLESINSIDEAKKIPLFIVSSEEDLPTVMSAIELGAMNYITKPIDIDKLRLKLKRSFNHQS